MGLNLAANGAKCEDPRHNDGTISPIRFHESWDWIMPVIDKIERWGYPIVIRLNVVEIYSLTKMLGGQEEPIIKRPVKPINTTKLKAAYSAVCQFINNINQL